jgi:hypothetical protein
VATIFIEGFDKYGPLSVSSASQIPWNLTAEWTSATAGIYNIVAPLSSTGFALSLATTAGGNVVQLSKTFPNVSRIIGGYRFQTELAVVRSNTTVFTDGGTPQVAFDWNATGNLVVRSGLNGTILGTSAGNIGANSTHTLSWDITIGTTAAFQFWVDGVSFLSGTGDTGGGTVNNQVNSFAFYNTAVNWTGIFDDLYLFDSTGSTNNAVLLTNPRVETGFPNSDSAVQFSFGAAIVGKPYWATAGTIAPGANQLFIRPFTPVLSCTLNSVSVIPSATSAVAKFKAVLYSDSSGSPDTLTATGAETVGTTAGIALTSAFGAGQSLTGGTQYWLGFITDTSVALHVVDAGTAGQRKANTYTSGAPAGPLTGMTTGQNNWVIYGNVSGISVNYAEVNLNPPADDLSFVFSATVGHEDLYGFPALSTTPSNIYVVAVKGYIRNATSGGRTIDLRMKSNTTTSSGSNPGQSPGTSYLWFGSHFETDPDTSASWTISGLNAAKSGEKIAS